jgi:hypothetical protein
MNRLAGDGADVEGMAQNRGGGLFLAAVVNLPIGSIDTIT